MSAVTPSDSRNEQLARLVLQPIDILVIGGGIVGSGIARDAAMRGLRTVVIDQFDFAFGTSSRSSRLLHGGLRYLAQGRIGLVREASHEKMILSRIAPHLAKPLPFIFPTYKGTEWKWWKLRIGVKVYDWLCGKSNLGRSTGLSAVEVLQVLPGLQTHNLTGAVRYFDGFTCDARLVLDTLRSAAAHGATPLNYFKLTSAEHRDSHWHCRLEDMATGRQTEIRSRAVINAAGAWAERLPQSKVHLRLTKGVHIVIDRSRLPIPDAVVMAEGSRILFAIPWGERTILGTTDTDYDGPIENPTCDEADIAYVLKVTNNAFPGAAINTQDIISTWAGLRPLIADPNGKPSDISRAHEIDVSQEGWADVAGGKLTTYRLMAEQTLDKLTDSLGIKAEACRTAQQPLLQDESDPAYSGVIPTPVTEEAVDHYCRREWARYLDDVMIRRAGWQFYHRDHDLIATKVASWMADSLGWSPQRRDDEIKRYRQMTAGRAPLWQPAVDTIAADRPAIASGA